MNDTELAEEIERRLAEGVLTFTFNFPRWRQIIAALRSGHEHDLPEYHDKECYYCHERISAFDSTRGPGGCALCHADEPGVVKWHHSSCVSRRLCERPPSGEMVMMPRELPAIAQKMAEAVRWIIRDAVHKAPEQIGDIAERWIMRLREVEEFANAVLSAAEAEGRKS